PPVAAVTDLRFTLRGQAHRVLQAWPVQRQRLQAGNAPDLAGPARGREADVVYSIADIEVPAGAVGPAVRMFALHERGFVEAQPLLLDATAVDALLHQLEEELADRKRTAWAAEPGTLSRRRRQLQGLD